MTHDELIPLSRPVTPHDELLAKIAFDSAHHLREALRAVVELHKPTVLISPNEIRCDDCLDEYPCPTIQAIEKELK